MLKLQTGKFYQDLSQSFAPEYKVIRGAFTPGSASFNTAAVETGLDESGAPVYELVDLCSERTTECPPPRIELGSTGWSHPDVPGMLFGSKEGVRNPRHDGPVIDREKATHVDTRPTLGRVLAELMRRERILFGQDPDSERYSVGPWDEYFSCAQDGAARLWPEKYRWIASYVVSGGSEGIYLHVDAVSDGKVTPLFVAKTCREGVAAWQECAASAGRIGWLLGA